MDIQLLGYRLRVSRALRELTLEALAELVGVNKSTLSRYELGLIRSPSWPLLMCLADALEVNPAWLMGSTVQQPTADDFDNRWVEVMLAKLTDTVSPVSYRRKRILA